MSGDWIILEKDLHKLLAAQQPRRKGIYLHQLGNDLRSLKMLVLFATMSFLITVGFYRKELDYLFVGILMLAGYLFMLHKVTYDYIHSPVIEAEITNIGHDHPIMNDISISEARTNDGKTIPVSLVTKPAKTLFKQCNALKVKILYCPKNETSLVLAIKAG